MLDVKILSVRHGSSSSIVAELSYAPGAERTGLPKRIFFKGGFNPELIAVAPSLLDTYRREAEFYHYLHHKLASAGMRLPQPYYTGVDSVSGQGIVVVEDLEASSCSFGTPLEPWPLSTGDWLASTAGWLSIMSVHRNQALRAATFVERDGRTDGWMGMRMRCVCGRGRGLELVLDHHDG